MVSIYKLYCADLPNSEEVKQQLAPFQHPATTLKQIMADLQATKYANFVYSLPSAATDFTDYQTNSWKFVDQSAIALLKTKIMDFLDNNRSATELDHGLVSEVLINRPLSDRVTLSEWNAVRLLVSDDPYEQTETKWAILLVRAFNTAFTRNFELIAKLVVVELPLDMINKKAAEMELQERPPSTDVIRRCVAVVDDDIIGRCDAELSAFGLAMTQSTRASLHMLMLQYLVASHFNYHKRKLDETLASFEDQTVCKNWKANFIEQIIEGPNRDMTVLDIVVEKFKQKSLRHCLEGAKSVVANAILQLDKTSTRFAIQLQFERDLNMHPKEKILDYIGNTQQHLKDQFEADWQEKEVSMLEAAGMVYQREAHSVMRLAEWVAELHTHTAAARCPSVSDIFLAPSGFDAVQVLQKKEKALVLLFRDLLQDHARTTGYNIDGLQLDIGEPNILCMPAPTKTNALERLIALISELVVTISDLQGFAARLSAGLREAGDLLMEQQCSTKQLDSENLLQTAREKAAGCNQLCPCCRKCCDEEHWRLRTPLGQGANLHRCRLGHQIRGMAGISYDKTKFASLKICGHMRDNELIWFHDRFVYWRELKSKFPSWDFHSPLHLEYATIEEAANRVTRLWNNVGREICAEYPLASTTPLHVSTLLLEFYSDKSIYLVSSLPLKINPIPRGRNISSLP